MMNRDELKEFLISNRKGSRLNIHFLTRSGVVPSLIEYTSFCPDDYPVTERIQLFLQDFSEVPRCLICGSVTHSRKGNNKIYEKYCSPECREKNPNKGKAGSIALKN